MCGIAGLFRPDGGYVDPARVHSMNEVMIARGPDAFGLDWGPGYALGSRRLAIIDLSDNGIQPLVSEDGSIRVVFNGEIYNFPELRSTLCSLGHRFHSNSDTEILVHGYERWGLQELLKRIRGMYAFAIYDRRRHEVHLARDPLGKKPLFWQFAHGELAFASSARALAAGLEERPVIRESAVDQLLCNLYIPGPKSIFEGVEKLSPGHVLTFGRTGKREIAYWKAEFGHVENDGNEYDWLDRVDDALRVAVTRRLISDVPVGVMLSGGVDSSLVTAFAAKAAGSVQTFSVANEDPAADETRFALAVARHCHTEHRVLPVRGDIKEDLPSLVASMGEPLGDASAANLFAISKLARQFVGVVLTGDGGDEAFGGYSHMWAAYQADRLQPFLPFWSRSTLARLARRMPSRPTLIRRAATLMRYATQRLETTFNEFAWIEGDTRGVLYTDELREVLGEHSATDHYRTTLSETEGASRLDRILQAHMKTILADDYLPKVDLATMGASLEARSPFLDVDVVKLAMRMPTSIRFSGGAPKGLLRRLACQYVPPNVIHRPKQGFTAPVGRWLRSDDWRPLLNDLVLGDHVERRGWFRRATLERIVREQQTGKDRSYLLWCMIVLELWSRLTVDSWAPPAAAKASWLSAEQGTVRKSETRMLGRLLEARTVNGKFTKVPMYFATAVRQ